MVAYNTLPYFIQGLIDPEYYNDPYNSWSEQGQAVELKFNFAVLPLYGEQNMQLFTAAQKASVQLALAKYADVSGLSFVQAFGSTPAQLTFFRDDLTSQGAGDAAGYTWYPSWYYDEAGDVHINSLEYPYSDTFEPGNYAFQVLLHEIGHGIGLKHTFETPVLPAAEDTQANSVMTYNIAANNAVDLGMFDLAAIQLLYGVNPSARSGNNVYSLADRYIWDGGGVDTIDASGETIRLTVKLTEGSWIWSGAQSSSILDEGQAFIGFGTLIERVKGGSSADLIMGNEADNLLFGNAGFDALWGLNGTDTLFGGAGNDRLFGGNGNDALYGGNSNDALVGGSGVDLLVGGAGNDTLLGGMGKDTLTGGSGFDVFTFQSLAEAGRGAGRDVITDFVSGQDQIDLHLMDANSSVTGNQAFAFVGSAAFSGVAGQLRYAGALNLLAGDINGDGVADFQIELTGVLAISGLDILA